VLKWRSRSPAYQIFIYLVLSLLCNYLLQQNVRTLPQRGFVELHNPLTSFVAGMKGGLVVLQTLDIEHSRASFAVPVAL
jgi:hypothetical protein